MKKPNFFIVGAPKCGTTSMYFYLKGHPDIFMPVKEFHFFGSDQIFRKPRIGQQEYLSKFQASTCEKRLGEGSVSYLYSRTAAYEIKEFNSESRIIIMLRNPVDQMYSLHAQCVYSGVEDIKDFSKALQAEENRKEDRNVPKTTNQISVLLYRDRARYFEQVKRYMNVFGRDYVHVIVMEDLEDRIEDMYKDVLRFLEVDPEFSPVFKRHYPSKRIRSRLLREITRDVLPACGRLLPARLEQRVIAKIRWRLEKFNTKYRPLPPMELALRQRLQAEFKPEIERLSGLLDRDLTYWSKESAAYVSEETKYGRAGNVG